MGLLHTSELAAPVPAGDLPLHRNPPPALGRTDSRQVSFGTKNGKDLLRVVRSFVRISHRCGLFGRLIRLGNSRSEQPTTVKVYFLLP